MTGTSWDWPEALVGLPVLDVDGGKLGRVARVDDAKKRIDVALAPRAERRLGAPGPIVRVPFEEIVDADDHEVTLREEARFVVHPEERPTESIL